MNTEFRRVAHGWRNMVAIDALVLIVFLMIWVTACSSGSPGGPQTNKAVTPPTASSAVTTTESVPAALSNAGEYGENIYD